VVTLPDRRPISEFVAVNDANRLSRADLTQR